MMSETKFAALVGRIEEEARSGKLLSEELFQLALELSPRTWCQSEPEAVALALRTLGGFCYWTELRSAENRLNAGVQPDQLHLEIQRMRDERDEWYSRPEFRDEIAKIAVGFKEIQESERGFLKWMRDVECLMGFDQEFLDELLTSLGSWESVSMPNKLLELLPEAVSFPLQDRERLTPYDHRLHLLVKELVSRLGEAGLQNDEVIKHCGHVLTEIYYDDEGESAGRLFLRQMTLLADEYLRQCPWDIIGHCWRGELACWEGDRELSLHHAGIVWQKAMAGSADSVQQVTEFFGLTGTSSAEWLEWRWERIESPIRHFGELEERWLDRKQPLVWGIVRAAFRRGNWDTPLLCSIMGLWDNGYLIHSEDVPVPCWVWMAENVERTRFGSESYYLYWNNAFEALREDTDPTLAHNITVATLGGLIFQKGYGNIEASIQRVLESLAELHRRHPLPEKERVALELIKFVYRELKPEHLTAADRMAIEKAIGRLDTLGKDAYPRDPAQAGQSGPRTYEVEPLLVDQMDSYLRSVLGESIWSRLSPVAKDHFKHGEFYFSLASKRPGDRGDFNSFVLAYSRGLLAEIQESVRGPLKRDPSLKGEFLNQFCEKESPEWPELLRYMSDIERNVNTRLGKALMAQRVQLDRLESLRESFTEMKDLRNDAAHSGRRVDREKALLFHNRLINKGFIGTVVEVFPKPVRR